MHRSHRLLVFLILGVAVGCSNSSDGGGTRPPERPLEQLRIDGPATAGAEGDALAAALLLGVGAAADRPGRARFGSIDADVRVDALAKSAAHLLANAFTTGAGAGAMGSVYVRRLAAGPNAPIDRNGNGTNLDETLATHYEYLARFAGGSLPATLRPTLFPWRDGQADYREKVDAATPSGRTKTGQVGQVSTEQVGEAMLARLMLATALLQESPDPAFASLPDRRLLGLLVLQQVLAMEETLFTNLFMDGSVLAALRFPVDYDPAQNKRWVPQAFRANEDPTVPGLVSSYSVAERSSELAGLAALMRAGAELAFLASKANPDQASREALRGLPFGPPPDVEGGAGLGPGGGADSRIITWEDGPGKIISRECAGCHDPNFPPEPGLFAADSYDNVHKGGRNSRPDSSTPIITRGDPSKSVLYYILLENPPAPFFRMPDGGPPWMKQDDIDLIKKWIEDGARSSPPGPPRVGFDLAVTMWKNLVALHVGPNGELFERHDGDAPVPFMDPVSTGAALRSLASLAQLAGELNEWKATLQKVAEFAGEKLVSAAGDVSRSYDVDKDTASGAADLLGYARMTAGLFAAGRALGSATVLAQAELVAKRLVDGFFDGGRAVFRRELGSEGVRYSPAVIAAVVDALREMDAAGVTGAQTAFTGFMKSLRPVLAYSELSGRGEVLGDGVADTDRNGVPEPALAGAEFGRAPVFVGSIKDGFDVPVTDTVITWSKHIQPLFRSKCGNCHMDGSTRGDGYFVDTPELLRKTINPRNPMALVVPGDPENSFLYRKLVDRVPTFGEQMPLQVPPLAAHGKELVRRWILDGARNR